MITNLSNVKSEDIKAKLIELSLDDVVQNITDLQETTELIINLSSCEDGIREDCFNKLSEKLYIINKFAKFNRDILYS